MRLGLAGIIFLYPVRSETPKSSTTLSRENQMKSIGRSQEEEGVWGRERKGKMSRRPLEEDKGMEGNHRGQPLDTHPDSQGKQ